MSDATTENTTTTTPESPTTPETQHTNTPTPTPQEPQTTTTLPDDPEQLKTIIHRLRNENAKTRTDAKTKAAEAAQASLIDKIGRALGIITDTHTPTVEELTSTLTDTQHDAHQARLHLAVYKTAHGKADADALLDSHSFRAHIANIDPNDTSQLTHAITQFIADNPRFTPAQVAGASAVEHAAGSGEQAVTLDQFRAMNGQQRNALHSTNPNLYRQLADQA